MRLRAEQEKRSADAEKAEARITYWHDDVIPYLDSMHHNQQLYDDWWFGIPSSLRSKVSK